MHVERRGRRRRRPWTRARALLRRREGRGARARAVGADAWITGIRREQAADARQRAARRVGRQARGMWKYNPLADWTEQRPVAAHPRARPALPPAARPGLRLDRLRAVHAARRRPRGPLGRHRQDRVRAPRRALSHGPARHRLRPRRRHPRRADRHRRRLADDAAADPLRRRAAGRRGRHRPRLRRGHEDRRRLAPPAHGHGRPRRVEVAGVRLRPGLARRRRCWSSALHRRYGDGFDDDAAVGRRGRAAASWPFTVLARALFMRARRASATPCRSRARPRSAPSRIGARARLRPRHDLGRLAARSSASR